MLLLCTLLLQDAVRPIEVTGGGWAQASQLADGLAHRAGVVRQALNILKGQVDDLVATGVAIEVATGEALQTGLIRNATLAVWQVGAQRQGAGQGAALQAAGLAGTQLGGRPDKKGNKQDRVYISISVQTEYLCVLNCLNLPDLTETPVRSCKLLRWAN